MVSPSTISYAPLPSLGNAQWVTGFSPATLGFAPFAQPTSPNALTPTAYTAQPLLPQTLEGYGTLLLDSLSDALMPTPLVYAAGAAPAAIAGWGRAAGNVAGEVGSFAAAGLGSLAANVAPVAGTVAAPVAGTIAPIAATSAEALRGYGQQATPLVQKARRKAKLALSGAKRVGRELWAGVRNPRQIHITQVPSKYNAHPAAGNRDCGPASVAMVLKLVGKRIPGAGSGASPQAQIDAVRRLAGKVDSRLTTTNWDLERALRRAGATVREIGDAASVRQAVLEGKPVVLNGNPRNPGAYGSHYSAAQLSPYNGAHWIAVTGYDAASGKFIVNDPLSKIGPIKVSKAQLDAYRGGSIGIEVTP